MVKILDGTGVCRLLAIGLAAVFLAGCGLQGEQDFPEGDNRGGQEDKAKETGFVFGQEGLYLFGGEDDQAPGDGTGIGVNSFLWRASLDTISFMPLNSADPFGGVIITDWYSPPEVPNERFKVNVFILGRQLRADGIKASVFRQQQVASNLWQDSPVQEETVTDLENAILARARQLRIETDSQ